MDSTRTILYTVVVYDNKIDLEFSSVPCIMRALYNHTSIDLLCAGR
jgi:hypothetical protein